jgi:hypothetical protein
LQNEKESCSNHGGHGRTKPEENGPHEDVKTGIEPVETMNPEVA